MQATLLYQLRRAAAEQIATVAGGKVVSAAPASGADEIDDEAVYAAAQGALDALASLLSESATGWAFGVERPGMFDAALFSYTHLMMEFMSGGSGLALGTMVAEAGNGELVRHRAAMLDTAWPGWDASKRIGGETRS